MSNLCYSLEHSHTLQCDSLKITESFPTPVRMKEAPGKIFPCFQHVGAKNGPSRSLRMVLCQMLTPHGFLSLQSHENYIPIVYKPPSL